MITPRRLWLWVFSALLLGMAPPTRAASGGELKRLCAGASSARDIDLCAAYLSGVVSTLKFVSDSKKTAKPITCLPASMSGDQMIRIATEHLRLHPQLLNHDAAELVTAAFSTAFPCN